MSKILALVSLVIVLGLVNWSIYKKEDQLTHGKIAYLELAPIDPRSIMQGDYMALNYQVARQVYDALPKSKEYKHWRQNIDASDGYAVVALDERNIATFKDIYHGQALAKSEILMRYRVRNGAVKFATNAYFFQEGTGKYYQPAHYGQFRVANDGELLLVAMYDKDLNKLGIKGDGGN